MGDITKDFNRDDFRCHCTACLENVLRPATKIDVVEAVQRLRDILGTPVKVTCGVRCETHNRDVGGAPASRHLPEYSDAVDIYTDGSVQAAMIVGAAWQISTFTAFRVYGQHVHLDARPGPRRFIASPE